MRFFVIVGGVLALACSGGSTSTPPAAPGAAPTQAAPTQAAPAAPAAPAAGDSMSDLSALKGFPTAWVMLTDQGGKKVIFEPCAAENRHFEIDLAARRFTWAVGQEALEYTIKTAAPTADGVLVTPAMGDAQQPPIRLTWLDASHETIRLLQVDQVTQDEVYVRADLASKYPTVKEPASKCGM